MTKQSITEKRSDGSFQVRFARRIPHPVERVWEALTDPIFEPIHRAYTGKYGTPDD